MGKKIPIFYNALLLTGVNLLLRFVGTSFQVFLSGKIGAEGIGLLQLVLSIGSMAMTVGMGGIRTATMYLCAEAVGQKRKERLPWIISGCVLYSLLISSLVGILLFTSAPWIANKWIGDRSVIGAVRLLAVFLPVNCLCGVMVGHFTGINRIGTLAVVEVAEQLLSMGFTIILLSLWAKNDTARSCLSVIVGSGSGAAFTLVTLVLLKQKEKSTIGTRTSVRGKLFETAVPLAIADDVKAGISTTENLMVPKRLGLYANEMTPLATFGIVCGMVFPVIMFPTAILFGLAELLIPELARCNAAGSRKRIKHLAERSLMMTLIYGAIFGGILILSAENLCMKLYGSKEAGNYLQWYAILAPMLYCDMIVDAMAKGLGQQKICVRYNIITSALDVALLYILLPRYGMNGYFVSFLITHLLNFCLSARLLFKITGNIIPLNIVLKCILSASASILTGMSFNVVWLKICVFLATFLSLSILLGVIKRIDYLWLKKLILHAKR